MAAVIAAQAQRIFRVAGRIQQVIELRVLAVDTKGLTGRKKIVTAVPYDKVSAYATESGSLPSFEGTLTLWNRGLGTIAFVFEEKTDIRPVLKAIAESS